jgi:guanylate kinase
MIEAQPQFKRRGLVICVSGPSGVGKGTIIKRVMAMRPNVAHSISVTTRAPRPGEKDGVDYYFRDENAFRQMLDHGEILESDYYCGNYYGTPLSPLEQLVSQGIDVLLDITVPGSISIMKNYPEAISLFLLPPSFTELQRRLEKRGTEDAEVMQRRLQKARDEIGQAKLFKYLVVNDDLDETARRILAIFEAEHCRYDRLVGVEETILAL